MSIVEGKKWRGWQLLFVLLLAAWFIIGSVSATPTYTDAIGFQWNTSDPSPTVQRVFANGTPANVDGDYFNNHVIWGNMKRVLVNSSTGVVTYGTNNRGDGLDLNGTLRNQVMTEIPMFYSFESYTAPYMTYIISPTQYNSSFAVHPMFNQRGDGTPAAHYYVGAYEMQTETVGSTLTGTSYTGKTPVVSQNISTMRSYAEANGKGWGLMNIWTLSGIRELLYIEMGTLNSQTAWGNSRGVVDATAGMNAGADSADTNIWATNATGGGTGVNGKTPVVFHGLQDVWGNRWEFADGQNSYTSEANSIWRTINRTGLNTTGGRTKFQTLLIAGDYETSTTLTIAEGYQKTISTVAADRLLMIPTAVGGSDSKYLTDYFYYPRSTNPAAPNILILGGSWSYAGSAGVGTLTATYYATSLSAESVGARLEFRERSPPIAEFNGTPTSGFAPLSVQFTDESANYPTAWNWSFGDGSYNETQNPEHLYTSVGSFNVNLTVSNTAGSNYEYKASYITTTLANPNPSSLLQYKVGTSNTQINNQTPYTGTGTIRNISSGITRVLTNFTWDPAYVSVTDIRVNKSVANITGLAIDSSEIYGSYAIVNMSKATDFTAPANVMFDFNITYTTYAEPGTIAVFGFDNSSRYYDTANATWWPFTYRNTANAVIGSWGPITNDFSADSTSVELGTPITFTGTSTGYPDAYTWDFGDSDPTNSTEQNPVHTYASTGTYDVSFTAYLSANATVSNTTTKLGYITVWNPPVANFTGTPRNGQVPLTVTFTDLSTDTTSWLWDFGDMDATNATEQNPVHTYASMGSYNVSLNASNIYSSNTMNKTDYVVVSDATVANFTYSPHYGATPLLVTFTDTSTGSDISTWHWDFGDGNTSVLQSPTHTYDFDGVFQVNLTVSNLGGSSTKLQNVTVAAFSSEYTGTPTVGPSPLSVSFTEIVHGLDADSYYWEFGDGNTSALQNPTNIYPSPGYYTVRNRVMNGSTEYWLNKTNYIEAYGIVPSFTVSNTTSYDVPLSVQFTDTSTNVNATPSSYYYVFGDGSSSTEQNPTHTYTTYGVFEANLTVSNATQGVSSTTGLTSLSRLSNNTVSSISYNWVMNAIYPTTIMVKDSQTLALIGGTSVTVSGSTYILDNGILSNYFEYGPHTFFVEAEGYSSKTTSLFVVGNSTFTILLDPISGASQTTWWTPHTVQITVMSDAYGTRLPNVLVEAYYNESAMPTAWIETLYGIQSTAAGQMLNQSLTLGGTTGSDGTLTTSMLGSLKYDIYLTSEEYGLNNYHVSTYPSDSMLNIYVPITGQTLPTSGNSTYVYLNNTRLYITQPNISYVSMCIDYQDLSGTTSTVSELWWFGNNNSIFGAESFVNPGMSLVTNCKTLYNVRGTPVYWNYSAVTGI